MAVNEGSVARRFVIFGSGTDGDIHVAAAMSHIGESGYVQLAMAQLVFLLEVEGVVIYEWTVRGFSWLAFLNSTYMGVNGDDCGYGYRVMILWM